ncbi:amidohydrolase family protein [Rhodovarius lipocyclicus]|uniref:amidohydrolase family protein n=1 Tax=Rhodovarius lipocyclicus TaxID=268410 RepID=UPI00135A99A1|nr:amidohydrolase family protein [Rhodovarius lipocyclicus]
MHETSTLGMGGVDTHAHVMRRGRALSAERHSEPARDVEPQEFLTLLDAHGLGYGVLTAPSFYGFDNSLLLEALAAYPTRLRGTANVAPGASVAQLAALKAQGIAGIRLNWTKRTTRPDAASPEYQALFAAAREAGLHLEIFLEGPLLPGVLPHALASGVDIVLDHFAAPNPALGLNCPGFRAVLAAMGTGRCWVKLSAPYRLGEQDPAALAQAMLRAGGAERLLWASDWPWISHEEGRSYAACLNDLSAWVPDAAQRRTILLDTPKALFGFA